MSASEAARGAKFFELAQAERNSHVLKGWTPLHDQQQGVDHLLRLALDYLANGKTVQAGSLIMAAREIPTQKKILDVAKIAAVAEMAGDYWQKMFEDFLTRDTSAPGPLYLYIAHTLNTAYQDGELE